MKKQTFKAWALVSKRGNRLQSTETEPLLFLTRRSATDCPPSCDEYIQRVTVTVKPIKPKRARRKK